MTSLATTAARRIVLAAAIVALTAVQAVAAGALRSEIRVTGPVVTLGDFFPDAGRHGATPLFRSPDLGTRGNVPASLVVERARAAGYEEADTDGLRSVSVERLAITVGARELEEALRERIVERYPNVDAKSLEVNVAGMHAPVLVDASETTPVRVDMLDWNPASGQLRATVRVRGEHSRTLTLTGSAMETIEIFTATRPIDRGAIISASDLAVDRMPRQRLAPNQVTDRETVVGLAARRSIQPGRPIFRSDFEEPILVRRGERVTMIYRVAGMTLTTVGQAMESGSAGAMIDILNLQSRRTITATVRGHDQVEVGFSPRRLAQLQETN